MGPYPCIPSGPAVMCTAPTGRTQDCTRPQRQTIKLILAMREPSTQDIPSLPGSVLRAVPKIEKNLHGPSAQIQGGGPAGLIPPAGSIPPRDSGGDGFSGLRLQIHFRIIQSRRDLCANEVGSLMHWVRVQVSVTLRCSGLGMT